MKSIFRQSFYLAAVMMGAWIGLADSALGNSLSRLRPSVFKIHVQSRTAIFDSPWQKSAAAGSSGTGFYIGNGRIMTNAHVVAGSTYIAVQRDGDSSPEPAYVEFIGHDCDLAILKVQRSDYFNEVPVLPFGKLPKLRSPVSTIGFPTGGEQISITEGVVSRVDFRRYVHDGEAAHLLVQVDSAINPGNSGGPVIQGRHVVGVAFQAYTRAENTGYIIPTPVVHRFLKDIEDGTYDGHPKDGLITEEWTMMNPSTILFHGLLATDGGVKVVEVADYAPTAGYLRPRDILLAINSRPIGVDGKVVFGEERVDFRAVFDLSLPGDIVGFDIMRDNMRMQVKVPVIAAKPHHELSNVYAKYPKYFVYGGLVFTALSRSYLETWGGQWYRKAPLLLRYLQYYASIEPASRSMRDIIVYARHLPHPVNRYAGEQLHGVVTFADGKAVTSLEDFARHLETGKQEYAVIEFWGVDDPLILNREQVRATHEEITTKYGVNPDRWFAGAELDAAIREVH